MEVTCEFTVGIGSKVHAVYFHYSLFIIFESSQFDLKGIPWMVSPGVPPLSNTP